MFSFSLLWVKQPQVLLVLPHNCFLERCVLTPLLSRLPEVSPHPPWKHHTVITLCILWAMRPALHPSTTSAFWAVSQQQWEKTASEPLQTSAFSQRKDPLRCCWLVLNFFQFAIGALIPPLQPPSLLILSRNIKYFFSPYIHVRRTGPEYELHQHFPLPLSGTYLHCTMIDFTNNPTTLVWYPSLP